MSLKNPNPFLRSESQPHWGWFGRLWQAAMTMALLLRADATGSAAPLVLSETQWDETVEACFVLVGSMVDLHATRALAGGVAPEGLSLDALDDEVMRLRKRYVALARTAPESAREQLVVWVTELDRAWHAEASSAA